MTTKSRTIVVTGSHSVGKTTLCNTLHTELNNKHRKVGLIPEIARILLARGISMNNSVSEFGIVNYILEYLYQSRLQTGEIIISDRSVFDLYAYISTSRPSSVRDEFVRLVEETVIAEVSRVELYIYVPIEFPLVVDDVRPAEEAYQREVDQEIAKLLFKLNARTLKVSGPLKDRIEQVVAALE